VTIYGLSWQPAHRRKEKKRTNESKFKVIRASQYEQDLVSLYNYSMANVEGGQPRAVISEGG